MRLLANTGRGLGKNVALPLMFGGVPEKERRQRARTLLERVGLGQRLTHAAVPGMVERGTGHDRIAARLGTSGLSSLRTTPVSIHRCDVCCAVTRFCLKFLASAALPELNRD